MKELLISLVFASFATLAVAQLASPEKKPADHPDSTGRTEISDEKGKMQPQGPTGPLNTGVGGAPAASPQGQTPPGMQSAPEGSSETIVSPADPKK